MYRPSAFAVDDTGVLFEAVRAHPFATIAAVADGQVSFAYAPVILDRDAGPLGGARFHLARANPLAQLRETYFRFSFRGPDGYVSPDWYETKGLVPTWNYIAVEAEGKAQILEDAPLRQLLVDLSAEQELRLRPKPPWTVEKMPAQKFESLLQVIVGFEVRFESLRGKFKLSQDKAGEDFASVVAALEARGDAQSRALAAAMRKHGRRSG